MAICRASGAGTNPHPRISPTRCARWSCPDRQVQRKRPLPIALTNSRLSPHWPSGDCVALLTKRESGADHQRRPAHHVRPRVPTLSSRTTELSGRALRRPDRRDGRRTTCLIPRGGMRTGHGHTAPGPTGLCNRRRGARPGPGSTGSGKPRRLSRRHGDHLGIRGLAADIPRVRPGLRRPAWHWVDPAIRYAKAAELLCRRGHLAVWAAGHAFPPGFDAFFTDIQRVYVDIGESHPGPWPPPPPDEVADAGADFEASGRFEVVGVRRYLWAVSYTADTYIELLDTFSGHIAMEAPKRELLYAEVRRLISARPDPRVTRHWSSVLTIGRAT